MAALDFAVAARLPAPGDNVAIASQRLEAGTRIRYGTVEFELDSTVLEGHRFAATSIGARGHLLSWGMPFGAALVDLAPGAYICNRGMLEAMAERRLDFELPKSPNFRDRIEPHTFDETAFRPGVQAEPAADPPTFEGFDRGNRGVGTRNHLVVLGTTSRTAAYARQLARRLQGTAAVSPGFDGVVSVSHTEGGGTTAPHNREFLLRVLAGLVTHPNAGAVLAVDYGGEAVPNQLLEQYMRAEGYPLDDTLHRFLTIRRGRSEALAEGESVLRDWLPRVSSQRRTPQPLSRLKLALQCGGSDAFSGISGNPLVAWIGREVIRGGGSANLAETDELIGAEAYLLQNVRDLETARRFLAKVATFKERVGWHGVTAEGNPSGGNKYRGLYNIALKSIGAAMKRHPEVRLDHVVDYGETMTDPGYYFMDSPGNDLESIAGQVASGANLILFVTGNGSVTNFPFVPTLKVLTTTARFETLARDMDVNAGAYQDGTPMDELGLRALGLALETASGRRTRGEEAGHSQVSIWRDWPQTDDDRLPALLAAEPPPGRPLPTGSADHPQARVEAFRTDNGCAFHRLGLVLPTSLCSAEVARLMAERLDSRWGSDRGVDGFAALVHTEGCGVSGGRSEELFSRTLLGYLTHPAVGPALVLEHGCEKTHNDFVRARMVEAGVDPERFGWVSVQGDGGIESAMECAEAWFDRALRGPVPQRVEAGLGDLHLGLLSAGPLDPVAAAGFARLAQWVAAAGGTAVLPEGELARHPAFQGIIEGSEGRPAAQPTLSYGERPRYPGLHVMELTGEHATEALTGLGATGAQLLLAHVGEHPLQAHPLVPLIQVAADVHTQAAYGDDLDLSLDSSDGDGADSLLGLVIEVAARRYRTRVGSVENAGFQITRGPLGVSL